MRVLLALFAAFILSAAASADQRIALVIGNSTYEKPRWVLQNPANDARAVAEKLEALGWTVSLEVDLTEDEMEDAVRAFRRQLSAAGADAAGLFYFSGHGMQADGLNWLLPIDLDAEVLEDVADQGLRLGKVSAAMRAAQNRVNFIIVNACRDDPLPRATRSGADSVGFAPESREDNILIAYAAAPGQVAKDYARPEDPLSPYASAFLEELEGGEPAQLMFTRIGSRVRDVTGGAQRPWYESGLTAERPEDDFVFMPRLEEVGSVRDLRDAPPQAAEPAPVGHEGALWASASADCEARWYLDVYPEGEFAAAARDRLQRCDLGVYWTDALRDIGLQAIAAIRAGDDGEALAQLSLQYAMGQQGRERDDAVAARLEQAACDFGSPLGCRNLGLTFRDGFVGEPDPVRAAAYLGKSCNADFGTACAQLAPLVEAGRGVDKDPARARGLYKRGCDVGSAGACDGLAWMFDEGRGGQVDQPRAAELFEQACEGGVAKSCTALGFMYERGEGVPENDMRAAALYRQACDAENALGCNNLGFLHAMGRGVEKDEALAAGFYQRACEAGALVACRNLALLFKDGRGVDADPAQAVAYHRQACEGGNARSCVDVGLAFEYGEGVETSLAMASTFYEKACDAQNIVGCTNLGWMFDLGRGVPENDALAATLYETGCEGAHPRACHLLGLLYEAGEGVAQDQAEAARLFTSGCDADYAASCRSLGSLFADGRGVAKDMSRAAALYGAACDAGDAGGCNGLGVLLENGDGVAQDHARAAELYRTACEAGNGVGCAYLGERYENGLGVEQDLEEALRLYRQAVEIADVGYARSALERLGEDPA